MHARDEPVEMEVAAHRQQVQQGAPGRPAEIEQQPEERQPDGDPGALVAPASQADNQAEAGKDSEDGQAPGIEELPPDEPPQDPGGTVRVVLPRLLPYAAVHVAPIERE